MTFDTLPLEGVGTHEAYLGSEDIHNLLIRELDAVHRLAYHLVSRAQDAEDLVQETFVRAFKSADRFRLEEFGPRPWLFRILHNVISSHYTARQSEMKYLSHLPYERVQSDGVEATGNTGLADLRWDSVDDRLKQALDALPMPARITFMLYALEGLKYREIAEVTEVPVGTVMSRLSRAREELASRLGVYAREQGWQHARQFHAQKTEDESTNAGRRDCEGVAGVASNVDASQWRSGAPEL